MYNTNKLFKGAPNIKNKLFFAASLTLCFMILVACNSSSTQDSPSTPSNPQTSPVTIQNPLPSSVPTISLPSLPTCNTPSRSYSYEFDLVTSWPTGLDIIFNGVTKLATDIEEASNGEIKIEVYPAGAKVGGLEVFDAVSSGTYEMGHTAAYYYVGKDPAHAFFTGMPFGLGPQKHHDWLEQEGQALWNELNSQDNLIAFPAGNTGPQAGGWFRDVLSGAEDLQGLKIRLPGLGGRVMSRAGANVQVLPGGEIYQALETGVLDATEWVGPYYDEKLGFHRIADNYYFPGWHEPNATLGLYINLDIYNSLPCHLKNIIRMKAAIINTEMIESHHNENIAALERLKASGTQVRIFPDDYLKTLENHAKTIEEESKVESEFYRRVWQSWNSYR